MVSKCFERNSENGNGGMKVSFCLECRTGKEEQILNRALALQNFFLSPATSVLFDLLVLNSIPSCKL